jgi:hypothetical protein
MLRRPPTAITLTMEDLAHYERVKQERELREQGYEHGKGQGAGNEGDAQRRMDPNDELKPLPQDRARIVRTRQERIMGGSGS